MKLYFMKQDAVDFMKHNMERLYTHYYQDKTNDWMEREYGSNPFSEFMEVPDFELAEIDAMSVGEVDFENCKILYNNLRSLSESQCSDERLWAGLCNGTFYDYMRKRYQYPTKQLKKKETDASAVISRFFFSGGTRSGFFRNGLAKCWWVGRATFDKNNDNHFERLDIIGPNDLTTKISDIFYSNTFASNPTILAGICDALKYFSDHGQPLDEKLHVRAAMQYLNAVGGATLLDVLTEEEICKIMTSRIISILKGQSGDIDVEEAGEEDQLLEEVIEEDEDEVSEEYYEDDEEYDDLEPEDNEELELEVEETVPQKQAQTVSTTPLNWFEEEEEEELPGPEFITYGCWVRVLEEKNNKEIIYHIPLKDDHSRAWYGIEEKLMGQDVGYRVFLAGKNYSVLDFGRDEDREDTKAEFNVGSSSAVAIQKAETETATQSLVKEQAEENKGQAEHDFFRWLRKQGFLDRVINQFKEYTDENGMLEIRDDEELRMFIKRRMAVCPVKERTLYKYYLEYWGMHSHW